MTKFNHKAHAFSKINLAYLAYCSKLVYKSRHDIGNELEQEGFNINNNRYYFSNDETHTQAFVAGDKHKIIIAFRGTEKILADWVTDLKIAKTCWTNEQPLGEVHTGFYQALISLSQDIYNEVIRLRTNNQSIWLTGHSLGGALATLAAGTLTLQQPTLDIAGVYTFGQPRVGNHTFAKNYNAYLKNITFRCVNNNDIVSRMPPQLFGYSHVGKLKYFDVDGVLHADNSLSWWAKFWDRLEGRYDSQLDLSPDGIDDHHMSTYLQLSQQNQRQ